MSYFDTSDNEFEKVLANQKRELIMAKKFNIVADMEEVTNMQALLAHKKFEIIVEQAGPNWDWDFPQFVKV